MAGRTSGGLLLLEGDICTALAAMAAVGGHATANGADAGRRGALIAMGTLPVRYRMLALFPAMFLATLFFLDQNITVRTVNSPSNKLSKGAAYHQDLCSSQKSGGHTDFYNLSSSATPT